MATDKYISATRAWIENFVIGLKLCPFAAQPYENNEVMICVNTEKEAIPIVNDVLDQTKIMITSSDIETVLVITPFIALGFEQYYDLVHDIQDVLDQNFPDTIVLVAFHPEFQYANSDPHDTANATNRSPYPMIHLLRKASLDKAATSNIDIEEMLERNQLLLSAMSWSKISGLYK